jgi:hypothetical protein
MSRAYATDAPLPYDVALSLLDRQAQPNAAADLRREATSLLERSVRLLAIRVAERQSPRRQPETTGHDRRSGRVEIIPH